MRKRFTVLLALVAFVLLIIPPASQAVMTWNGSYVNFKTATNISHTLLALPTI